MHNMIALLEKITCYTFVYQFKSVHYTYQHFVATEEIVESPKKFNQALRMHGTHAIISSTTLTQPPCHHTTKRHTCTAHMSSYQALRMHSTHTTTPSSTAHTQHLYHHTQRQSNQNHKECMHVCLYITCGARSP